MEPYRTVTVDADLWENTQCELYRLSTTYFNQDRRTLYLLHVLSNCKWKPRVLCLKTDTR